VPKGLWTCAGTGASGSSGGDRSDSAAAAAALEGQVGWQHVTFRHIRKLHMQ